MSLIIGEDAPLFSLPSTKESDFVLADQKGKYTLLFFYPKDFTTGCTAEACSFNDNLSAFNKMDCDVVGISTDSIESHHKFKNKFNLDFELLSDGKGQISKLYKAKLPFLNTSKRITYLISPDLKIEHVFTSMFKAKAHVSKMLDSLNTTH